MTQPKNPEQEFKKMQEEFNKLSRIVEVEYAAASLIARDLSYLYLEGKFDEMLAGLQKLTADTSPGAIGAMVLGQVTRGISDSWMPLAEERFPIDGPKHEALRKGFVDWLADGDKSPATVGMLLEDMAARLERNLYRCSPADKEVLFALVRSTGEPLLERKLASATAELNAARAYPDQEVIEDGGPRYVIPGGRLATAQRSFDNLTALKGEYDRQFPPVPKKPGPGPGP